MSILDNIKERQEREKREKALREGKPCNSPNWPDGFPKKLDVKPMPLEGYIEERIIFRSINGKKGNQLRNISFYVTQSEYYFLMDNNGKSTEWRVIAFEDYKKEYDRIFEHIKRTGKLTGHNKFSELMLFDEVIKIVPLSLVMTLKPSPEEIDQISAGLDAYLEDKYNSIDDDSNIPIE